MLMPMSNRLVSTRTSIKHFTKCYIPEKNKLIKLKASNIKSFSKNLISTELCHIMLLVYTTYFAVLCTSVLQRTNLKLN